METFSVDFRDEHLEEVQLLSMLTATEQYRSKTFIDSNLFMYVILLMRKKILKHFTAVSKILLVTNFLSFDLCTYAEFLLNTLEKAQQKISLWCVWALCPTTCWHCT